MAEFANLSSYFTSNSFVTNSKLVSMSTPNRSIDPLCKPEFAVSPDPSIAISVIIVSYNTSEITVQAVGSVLEHTGDAGVEVIVVDNNSSDDSVAAIRAAHPQVEVVATGINGGYAWGNNTGMMRARGRYILVMNPDALMHADTLDNAVAYMDANPDIGCLGPRVCYESGLQQSTLFRNIGLRSIFWGIFVPNRFIRNSTWFGDQRYAALSRDIAQDIDVVAGCFMMVPRGVIENAGWMDDRFFMYSEESEWCARIRRAGYVVRYNPDVSITHYGAVSTGETSPWKSVEIAKGHILFLRFSRGDFVAWLGAMMMLFADILRGLIFLPMSVLGGKERAAPWRARIVFLFRSVLKLPTGQVPPHKPEVAV